MGRWKKTLTTILASAVLIYSGSCKSDKVIPPQSEIRGTWEGTYEITKTNEYGNTITKEQYVELKFTNQKFFMDAIKEDLKPRITCDVSGYYELEQQNIYLKDTLVGRQVCNHQDLPVDQFSVFILNEGDSLSLKQNNEETGIEKNIYAKRTSY